MACCKLAAPPATNPRAFPPRVSKERTRHAPSCAAEALCRPEPGSGLAALQGGARRERAARVAARDRGLRRAGNARREPAEVASRARHLVLRELHRCAVRARLRTLPPGVRLSLQLVLRDRRAVLPAALARAAVASDRRGGVPLPGPRGPGDRGHDRHRRRRRLGRGCPSDRARAAPRAAAPGAAPHRSQVQLRVQSAEAGVPHAVRAIVGDRAPARLDRVRRRHTLDRLRGTRFRVRQRAAAAPCFPRAVPACGSSGDQRRISGFHGRRRLFAARPVVVGSDGRR